MNIASDTAVAVVLDDMIAHLPQSSAVKRWIAQANAGLSGSEEMSAFQSRV